MCDALLLDEASRSDTYPYIEIEEEDVNIGHEASVSKVGEEQLFYLMSRGIGEETATSMIVNGFIEPIGERATDGICHRDEPTDSAPDGRIDWLKR